MSEPALRLDSRKLSCLQHMGITVWRRRDAVAGPIQAPQAMPTEATPIEATPNEAIDTELAPAGVPNVQPAAAADSNALLQIAIEIAAADTSISRATAVIARASRPEQKASPLLPDEYHLLRKMMESIGVQAGQWIAVSEIHAPIGCVSSESPGSVTLSDLVASSAADVLLLLLPAAQLASWNEYWTDLSDSGPQAHAPHTGQMIDTGGRPVALVPLCDPQDLLQNGALKRDAWECLKAVRQHLSKTAGAATVG